MQSHEQHGRLQSYSDSIIEARRKKSHTFTPSLLSLPLFVDSATRANAEVTFENKWNHGNFNSTQRRQVHVSRQYECDDKEASQALLLLREGRS